jgi:3-deoxy-D-manno-octulosonic-acid transferase
LTSLAICEFFLAPCALSLVPYFPMNLLYTGYTALTSGAFLTCFPPFLLYSRLSGRFQRGLKERLGFLPGSILRKRSATPRIWMHASSLGEVKVAEAIIGALSSRSPGCEIILSTTTDHGNALARERFKELAVVYAPIDFIIPVRNALSIVRPDVMVFLETEIWPAWLMEAHRKGIQTALVNGRISLRSIRRYRKFRAFFREVLRSVSAFSMINREDADRIVEMGAEPQKVDVRGNAKYDLLIRKARLGIENAVRKRLSLHASQLVFVAGSTREGEEEIVLNVYERIVKHFPDMVLIIAPRHIVRAPQIESLLKRRKVEYQLRTEIGEDGRLRTKPVVLLNTFGELFELYSVGSINYCGASLVPLGGQNPLEAAAWGKMVFYGPHMEDFLDAKGLLENVGAGIEVEDAEAFAEKGLWVLSHPREAGDYGRRAREALFRNQGAGEKHADVILRLLNSRTKVPGIS